MLRQHEGKTYEQIDTLPLPELKEVRFMAEKKELDRSKIVSLYVCCYNYGEFIESEYLNSLRATWNPHS